MHLKNQHTEESLRVNFKKNKLPFPENPEDITSLMEWLKGVRLDDPIDILRSLIVMNHDLTRLEKK